MKYLQSREEIAKGMNFGKYPVLYIDLDNRKYEGYDYAQGSKVRLAWDKPGYPGMTTRGNLYVENGRYGIGNDAACLHLGFGRLDVLEDYEWANTALIHGGQTVIVVEDRSVEQKCTIRVMRVSKRTDIHCSTCAYLEDVDDFEI